MKMSLILQAILTAARALTVERVPIATTPPTDDGAFRLRFRAGPVAIVVGVELAQ